MTSIYSNQKSKTLSTFGKYSMFPESLIRHALVVREKEEDNIHSEPFAKVLCSLFIYRRLW